MFGFDSMEDLFRCFYLPVEDVHYLLENEETFNKMKKFLTYVMICNMALSHRIYRYEAYDEVNSFIKNTQKFYRACEKFFEIKDLL